MEGNPWPVSCTTNLQVVSLNLYLAEVELFMKGRSLVVFKKWWLLALVFTLALSLTSCSSRKKGQLTGGLALQCTGDYTFEIEVLPSSNGADLYDITVGVVQADAGDQVQVVMSSSDGSHDVKLPSVSLMPNKYLRVFGVSYEEITTYNILVVWQLPADANGNPIPGANYFDFLEDQYNVKANFCEISQALTGGE